MGERPHDPAAAWRRVEITGWCGRASRPLDIASGTALRHHPGMRVPIRRVPVRDVAGEFEPRAFLSTDLDADPLDIPRWFVRRWSVEVTSAEARRHLGPESRRQWSDKAIERTTPVLLGLYALIALWFDELMAGGGPPAHGASGCPKERLTFSDALAAVRHRIWTSTTSALSPDDADVMKVPPTHLGRLVQTARYPAWNGQSRAEERTPCFARPSESQNGAWRAIHQKHWRMEFSGLVYNLPWSCFVGALVFFFRLWTKSSEKIF